MINSFFKCYILFLEQKGEDEGHKACNTAENIKNTNIESQYRVYIETLY